MNFQANLLGKKLKKIPNQEITAKKREKVQWFCGHERRTTFWFKNEIFIWKTKEPDWIFKKIDELTERNGIPVVKKFRPYKQTALRLYRINGVKNKSWENSGQETENDFESTRWLFVFPHHLSNCD